MNFITKRIRQIFFMNKVQKRVIAAVLTVCMVFGFTQMPGMTYSAQAEESILKSTVTKITLNGSELTDETVVTNGALLKIEFDWALANTNHTTKEFEVNLNLLEKHNIQIVDSGKSDLMDNSGNRVGYYKVEDGGILKIVLEDEKFLNKDGRKGGVTIQGKVSLDNQGLKDGDEVTIGLGEKTYTPIYNTGITTSEIGAKKSASGSVYVEDGKFKQKFTLDVNAYYGSVKGISVEDTFGDALKAPVDLKIESSTEDTIEANREFSSMAELNAYLSDKTMEAGKGFKVSYTQEVDHTKSGIQNKAAVTYTNNKDGVATTETSAKASVKDPEISKTGVKVGDNIEWTITIKLNDYAKLGDIDSVLKELYDTPGVGANAAAESIKAAFLAGKTGSDGVYTYTYTTPIEQAYLDSPSAVEIKNTVDMTMTDDTVYSSTGTVGIEADTNWLTKTVHATYDVDTKILKWDFNIGPIPDGVKDITISDNLYEPWASNKGTLSRQWGLSVDSHEVIDADGNATSDFATYLSGNKPSWEGGAVVLNNAYVESKGANPTIVVTITTRVEDASLDGKVYTNRAVVSYTDTILGETKTITADGQYKQEANLVTKDGYAVSGKNSIRYRVKMFLDGYGVEKDDSIIITENFPTKMVYNPGTADLKASVQDPWGNAKLDVPVTYDGTNQFEVTVTDEMKGMISSDNPYLVVEYTLDVADEAEFVMEGTQPFKNNASVTYNGNPLGSDSVTVSLTPQKIISKTGDYSLNTAPYAEYTVYINEKQLDLVPDPGTLTATDTLGSALSYDQESIVVSKNDGAGNWTDLAEGEYQYTYKVASNSMVFTGLPDATWLRITYKARVNIAYGEELTPENSTNSIVLEGGTSDAVKASKGFSVVAVKPEGWATSEEGEIKLFKFWTNDGQMVALPNSVFKVLKMKYDAESNSMVEDIGKEGDVDWNEGSALLKDNITVGADGYVTIEKLSYSRIYALVEKSAPDGYAVATEPYYFVLAGSDAELPPADSGIEVTSFSSGATLYFENQKSDAGALEVTKSFGGVDSADVASVLSKLTFTVKKDGAVIAGGTFAGNTMTLSGGVYKKTFSNLPAGVYTVTEEMEDAAGYLYKTSTYEVTVGATPGTPETYVPNTEVDATVAAGTTKVDFVNTYVKTASLTVKKTVGGDVAWDDIKDSIVFYVYDSGDLVTPIATIHGSDMTADGAGYSIRIDGLDPAITYVVKESGAALSDYTKTTTWKIGDGAETSLAADEVTSGEVTLSAGSSETVSFHNDYEVHTGALKITKTVAFDSVDKTWDDVKGSLKFKVKNLNTGEELPEVEGTMLTDENSDGVYEYTFPNALPVGIYEVTETVTDITGMIVSTTYTIGAGAETAGKTAEVGITKDAASVVAYDNQYKTKYATLVLKKTVTGDLSWDDIDEKITFKVVGPEDTWEILGTALTPAGDNTYVYSITGIDVGGEYTITETITGEDAVNYTRTTQADIDGGTLQNGETITIDNFEIPQGATVQFYNDYERNVGNLVLKKTIEGVSASDLDAAADRIAFVVMPSPVDNQPSKQYKLSDFKKNLDGTYTLALSNVKTNTYHVKETVYELDGYDTKSVEYTLTAANGSVSDVSDGKSNGTDVTVEKDRSTTVAVADEYTKHTGNLEITKKVTGALGWNGVKEKLSFRVTNAETGFDQTYTHEDFTDADSDGVYLCTIPNVPTGVYVVTEKLENLVGYATTTTYQIGSGSAQVGKEAEITVAYKGQTMHVGFVNDYKKLTGSILLKKSVTGDQNWTQVRDTLSFVVLDENGDVVKTVAGSQLEGPDADGNYFYSIGGVGNGTYTIKEIVSGENVVAYTRTTTVKVDNGSVTPGLQGSFTFDADQGATAVIVNSYKRNEGQFLLQKTFAGVADADLVAAQNAVKFTVTPSPTGDAAQKEYALSDFVKGADGTYTLKILNVPTGTYHVKETAYTVGGYDIASVDYTVTSSGSTTNVANGKDNGANATVTTGKITTVAVKDTYTKTPTDGTLVITKTIKGDITEEEAKGALTFKVTNIATDATQTFTLQDFEYDSVTGKYTKELPLVAGGYKVEETTYSIDGYAVTVTNTVGGGAETTGPLAEADITVGGTTRVDFENDYRKLLGNLELNKTIYVDASPASEEVYNKIREKLEFLITGPHGYSKTIKAKDLPYDAVYKGFSFVLENLPVGVYTITEMVKGVPGYVYVSTENNVGIAEPLKAVVTVTDYVTTGTMVSVTYTNNYTAVDTGKIVIQKTLKGDITEEEAKGALQFTVTNEDTQESETYTLKDFTKQADGTYTLELEANVGGYTVEETIYDVDGYITDSVKYSVDGSDMTDGSKVSVDVTKDTTTTVAFEDAYTKNEGKLVLTKSVKGDLSWDDIKDDLSFVVKNIETGETKTYKASKFKDDDGDGIYTLVIDGLARGDYTVTEKLEDVKGYLLETTYSVDGGSKTYENEAKIVLGKNGVQLDFVNTYTSTKGKLLVTKTLKGNIKRKDAEAALEFEVTNTKTKKSKVYMLDDFTYDEETEKYVLELSLEPGTYKVTETVYDVKGYKLKSVTYTIGNGDKEEGASAKVQVKTGETIKVAFVDKYYKTKTSDNSVTQTPPTTSTTTGRDTPKTGDDSPLTLWFIMLLLGGCGIGGSIYGLRKNKK